MTLLFAPEQENTALRAKIQQLLQERYGKKSEKISEEELPVIDEAVVTPEEVAIIEEAEQEISVASYTRSKPKRKPIPQEFERETIVHDLPLEQQICKCGCNLHCIGEDTHEQLDYIPAKIKVLVHIRKKYGCRNCEIGVMEAPAPKDFIPKSLAAPGLLAHVILSKYEDHIPLYRQEKMWQRLGIELARSTLCNWGLLAAQGLQVLAHLQQEELLQLNYVRADETPVQVMEENELRTSKRAYMWLFASGRCEKAIFVYKFAMTRAGSVAEKFLDQFKGFLQTDGYSGYNNIATKETIIHTGCMAHARRKFVAIVKVTTKTGAAHYAVAVIAKLYRIEQEIKEKNLDVSAIKEYRQQYAKPILLEFKIWLTQKQTQAPPQSPLGKAVFYFLEHWEELVAYLEQGFLDIDNNFTERRIKPFAVGRKNWLFMGNERGGEAAAIFFGLIESAKANGLNTYAYFRYIMTKLPLIDPHNKEAFLELLPHRIEQSILQKYLN
jgi:transposase